MPPPFLPISPEAWAQDLRAKKDYRGLAAVTSAPYNNQWTEKLHLAMKQLREAGAEAIDAILEQADENWGCHVELANVLVGIGDLRAVPRLKMDLLGRRFSAHPSEPVIAEFVVSIDPAFGEVWRRAKEEEAAEKRVAEEIRLTAPKEGVQLREYVIAYIFRPAEKARGAYETIRTAIEAGKPFPLKAPHQVALVHGPAADFIAILIRLPTREDEGIAVDRRLVAWFTEVGTNNFDDFEGLNTPLPGRLSQGLDSSLGDQYHVLQIIDNL